MLSPKLINFLLYSMFWRNLVAEKFNISLGSFTIGVTILLHFSQNPYEYISSLFVISFSPIFLFALSFSLSLSLSLSLFEFSSKPKNCTTLSILFIVSFILKIDILILPLFLY